MVMQQCTRSPRCAEKSVYIGRTDREHSATLRPPRLVDAQIIMHAFIMTASLPGTSRVGGRDYETPSNVRIDSVILLSSGWATVGLRTCAK